MNPNCITAVTAAAGRPLTKAQIKAIDDQINSTMRRLARQQGPAWRAKSQDTRVIEAATIAMQETKAAAARKVENAQRQVLKTLETSERIAKQQALHDGWDRSRAQVEDITHTQHYIEGIKKESTGALVDLIEATKSTEGAGFGRRVMQFLFDVENPVMTRDLVAEIFGGADGRTGNAMAKAGARAWLDTIEVMRTRFNDAGGDVGKLDYGYLPQPHDQAKVRDVGREAWAVKTLDKLDRTRYLREDGTLMNDDEVMDFLRAAWETLATDGLNKTEPGAFRGTGARANRGSDSREIHFKDGAAFLAYSAEFGKGSMYDAMMGHIGAMSRDIGLVERMGPNPENQFRLQLDLSERADGEITRSFGNKPDAYWSVVSGKTGTPESARMAEVGQHVRNVQVFGKLGGAVISSITDLASIMVSTGFNKLDYWDLLKNTATSGGGDAKDFANAHGLIADSMANDMNRWMGENIANNWSGRIANATMKLSLMNAWTDTLRRGFSLTMQAGLGKLSRTDWADLTEWDRTHLERKGITAEDWAVIRAAQLTDYRGQQMLTPESIKAVDVAAVRPGDMQRITGAIAAQTAELTARNAQDQQWIRGRMDKFDAARDALNRQVRERAAKRLDKNQEATGPMLERMALLDAQREAAMVQADMEADFNRFYTQDEVRTFLQAVEDGAKAEDVFKGTDWTGAGGARREVRQSLQSAQGIGRRYGEAKGRLERRMIEIENRIVEMDRQADSVTNVEARAAQKKADEMLAELRAYTQRSQERQQRRAAVVQRLQAEEAPRLAKEAQRIKAEVVSKVLGLITDESEYAVINPDIATRAVQTWGGQQAGTGVGELARATMQFKSFPTAMISRHWRRMLDAPAGLEGAPGIVGGKFGAMGVGPVTVNRAAYAAAMLLTTTVLGAIAFQTKQIIQGKDPVDMTTPKFWTRAAAQGGGAGFVGDILLGDTTADRSNLDSLGRIAFGPTFGSVADLYELTKGNVDEAIAGKDTHMGAEALKFAKSHAPMVNLWYGKAAFDHLLLHSVQENLSPGYLARQQKRAKKDWDQDYWWEPGEVTPDRAPDLSAIGGP